MIDLDWMLHVNPGLEEKGMLVAFNPLDEEVTRTLDVDLYYTGLEERVVIEDASGSKRSLRLGRDHGIELEVSVPAGGMAWYLMR